MQVAPGVSECLDVAHAHAATQTHDDGPGTAGRTDHIIIVPFFMHTTEKQERRSTSNTRHPQDDARIRQQKTLRAVKAFVRYYPAAVHASPGKAGSRPQTSSQELQSFCDSIGHTRTLLVMIPVQALTP